MKLAFGSTAFGIGNQRTKILSKCLEINLTQIHCQFGMVMTCVIKRYYSEPGWELLGAKQL